MVEEVRLEAPQKPMDEYSLATPYGIVTIKEGGREVRFNLYPDVKQSRHNAALFTFVQQLLKQGVTQFNTDHIKIVGRDRTLGLVRGKARLDLVYYWKGKLYECELKTSREIGLDITAQQLVELVKYCENLTLLVPRGCLEEAANLQAITELTGAYKIAPYDYFGEDEE